METTILVPDLGITWTPKVYKIKAFWPIIGGLGLCVYIRLGFRYGLALRVHDFGLPASGGIFSRVIMTTSGINFISEGAQYSEAVDLKRFRM